MDEIATNQSYHKNFQFPLVFSCILANAALNLSLIVWCWQSDQNKRLERLEKLNNIEQPQEPCGCRPSGDLATKGSK